MKEQNKIQAFEYLVSKLLEWYEEFSLTEKNDLSILKVLKLTFFISAVGTNRDSENTLLDNIFDNYVAMPYGHVESDVYSFLKKNDLKFYNITRTRTELKPNVNLIFSDLNNDIKSKIDKSIEVLKEKNNKLILMSSFDLVELSHAWFSWKHYYAIARKKGTFSEIIPISIIKSENKIFYIN